MDDAPLTAEELSSELIGLGKDDNKLKKTQLFIGIGIAALLVILIIIIIIVAAFILLIVQSIIIMWKLI